MKFAQIFRNGSNQAIRIPRELEFQNVKSVRIERDGENLVLIPQCDFSWEKWQSEWVADDSFMKEGRQQPQAPEKSVF